MGIIKRMRKQTAVWWKRIGQDAYGKGTFDPPKEIKCRWEDKNELFLDAAGEQRVSQALVYVDRVMSEGDLLMEGTLESVTAHRDPTQNEGTEEIKRMNSLPNLRNTETLRWAIL